MNSAPGRVIFGEFVIERVERRLKREDEEVALSSRYFDALLLLVSRAGRLVTKEDFLAEVWHGVPVTDEALTQCIRSLRKALGDDAARPRFIETVPKHGYRFIAATDAASDSLGGSAAPHPVPVPILVTAGIAGGALAGLLGGLFYGIAGQSGAGAASSVLVLATICVLTAAVAAAGICLGMALVARRSRQWWALPAGGAFGGLTVGALGQMLGLDGLRLLVGVAPAQISGPIEGLLVGGTVGLGLRLGLERATLAQAAMIAGLVGAACGLLLALLGRPLMAGSIAALVERMPRSQFRLDPIGRLFGEEEFGLWSLAATTTVEAALFAAAIIATVYSAWSRVPDRPPHFRGT